MTATRISWPLRIWFAVEVLFGTLAVLAIGLNPGETKTNFAWPIQPVVMAAVLGAFYMCSAPLFFLPMLAKRWEMIRVMVLPAALFTAVQLLVTVVHWNKFVIGTIPFYVWFSSYLLPPPIFLAAYWWHQRQPATPSLNSTEPLPEWLWRMLVSLGITLVVGATLVFVFPQLLIAAFPWKLTPLTARSLCGWLIVIGTLLLNIALENHRTRVRLATPMLFVPLPALLMQMLRFADQVDWNNPVLWAGLTLFATVAFCGLHLARGSWRESLR